MNVKRYIYAPSQWQQDLIKSISDNVLWSAKHSNFTPWIAQTYAELLQIGFDFTITQTLNVDGIILADRDTLGNSYPFLPRTLLVCTKSDRDFHASANFHITHNRSDEDRFISKKIWKSYYVPHWPIPNIKPRDKARGSMLENIAYIGTRSQLADEFKSSKWEKDVKDLGLTWMPIFEPHLWNDYTNIDLIIAARKFPSPSYSNKGAIKLFNCWHAGVPALLAPESALMAERSSEYDFIPINSIDAAYSRLQFLKSNPQFYSQMLKRCYERSQTVERESIRNRWVRVFEKIENFYLYWQELPEWQKKSAFLLRRYLLKQQRLNDKIRNFIQIP